ncbi:MAG: septum formation initiator family protein [Syntrophales bacterium]|jgi:cell division protein FtsB|nr:septum formation initiator family protein [Syntrophales bacterium]MCK9527511.1 septum formation initiator family protein [Syntrophales bacterium]MDX9922568.1 septum formation initiator family protein [Syntrophales bacterium]
MKIGRYFVAGFFAMVLLILFSDRGLVEYFEIKEKLSLLETETGRISAENEQLRERIVLLRSDRDYLELIARRDLGMVREGEIIYRFREP